MSDAKWCDGCGSIFAGGIPGSESGIGRIQINGHDGQQRSVDQVRDWCPECVTMRNSGHQVFNPQRTLRQIAED